MRIIVVFVLWIMSIGFSIAQQPKEALFSTPLQKIFIHTDRDYYTAGGEIFYKIYVTNSEGILANTPSDKLFIELINGKGDIVESNLVNVTKGTAFNSLSIDNGNLSGVYTLRGYTEHNKSDANQHFHKTLFINGLGSDNKNQLSNDTIYIALLPEGGEAVDGIEGRLGIHARDHMGNPISFNGKILGNTKGTSFETDVNGMTSIEMNWDKNQHYEISTKVEAAIKCDFPIINSSGATIAVNVLESKYEVGIISKGMDFPLKMIVHQNGSTVRERLISEPIAGFTLNKESLPKGVLHLSLFGKDEKPINERLVFNEHGIDNFNIDISADRDSYTKTSLARITFDAYDDDGESIQGNFSLAVTDAGVVKPINSNPNIRGYHYLTSMLSEYIYEPNQYLSFEEEKIEDTDLLMRIYGWRKFKKLPKISGGADGVDIVGKITRKDQPNNGIKSKGFITFLGGDMSLLPFGTDNDGNISLRNLSFEGKRDIVIQAEVDNGRTKKKSKDEIKLSGNRNVDINIQDPSKIPYEDNRVDLLSTITPAIYNSSELLRSYEYFDVLVSEEDNLEDIQMSIDLDEVTISEEKLDEVVEEYRSSMIYSDPNDRIMAANLPLIGQYRDIYDVIKGRVTGLRLDGPDAGSGVKHKVILRGYTAGGVLTTDAAVFYVNGNYVPQTYAETINPQDIAFVDVVKTLHQLAAYGGDGVNGIVFIYLKPPGMRVNRKPKTYNGILSTTIEGYTARREFYVFNYSDPIKMADAPADRRITIHWEPEVEINEEGSVEVSFYTSTKNTSYNIILQGISKRGLPIYAESTIIVK